MKVKELLKKGSDYLGDRENSLLDCELLLSYVLGVEKEYLISNSENEIEESLSLLFHRYLDRIKSGEPVEYITGEKEFFGLSFFVDNRVLIPRPETEMLVEHVNDFIENYWEEEKRFSILEVGTGSCNIPVSIVKYFEDKSLDLIEEFTALEVDSSALEVAKINIDQYGLEDKINLFQSDLLEVIDDDNYFDVIVANLPYIGEVKNRFVSESTEKYEPNVALFGGEDGLELYEKMFKQITDKRINFSLLMGEFGFAQSEGMKELISSYFSDFEIIKDLAGIDRIFVIKSI